LTALEWIGQGTDALVIFAHFANTWTGWRSQRNANLKPT